MQVVALPAYSNEAYNSYNGQLYQHIEAIGQPVREFSWSALLRLQIPDILHVHWPEYQVLWPPLEPRRLARFVLFELALQLIRLKGGKVVWTAHNTFGHDQARTRLNLKLWSRFIRNLGAVIYLTEESQRALEAAFPEAAQCRSTVIQHGHYVDWLHRVRAGPPVPGLSRATLGIPADARVILNFGQIRAYKGVEALIQEFKPIADPTRHLVIAGEVQDRELEQRIVAAAAASPYIHCVLRRLTGAELAAALDFASLVVLPYLKITNSGSALLALSAHRRVYAPALGSLPELERAVGREWLRLYAGPLTAAGLREAVGWADRTPAPLDLSAFDWDGIARQTLALYRSLFTAKKAERLSPSA